MLQYFERQLESTSPIDADEAAKMVTYRVATGGDEAELTEYYNSKIGKKLLFYMKCDKHNFEVCKCFDDEIEETFKTATFMEMNVGGAVPKFEMLP
jgi:hypothetical protein